ncbi:hypothetical protein TrVE_jg14224 [Triparma verrucosa]|uniref:Uncharacterized protein n=1 Tax=Triparma verrucosa TaxID=1606542 RepID=A0A9W7BFB4_9STRA|nr:hypothetical protein TrVE_jg14224 [Triparma verrucosa]
MQSALAASLRPVAGTARLGNSVLPAGSDRGLVGLQRRGFKVVVPELDDRILDTGDDGRILKSHQRNASFAMRRLQNLQKQDRLRANERKHAFFTKPNQNRVRLSELKARNKSYDKINKIRSIVDWQRGDLRGMRPLARDFGKREDKDRILNEEEMGMKAKQLADELAEEMGLDGDEEGEGEEEGGVIVDEGDGRGA